MKSRIVGGLPESLVPSPIAPPQTTQSQNSALSAVSNHTTEQLGPEGDEYIPREYDEAGEKKVTSTGKLLDGRDYRCRTFFIPNRGDKLFMLATECSRILGYRNSYFLFNKNRSLYKIIATQAEKGDLIHQEILPFSYRSRQIAIVTAKSIFRQFGSKVIVNGRRVRDDYWEGKARKQGFTEEDLAGENRPGPAKVRDATVPEATAMFSDSTGQFAGVHPQLQIFQPGMIGAAGSVTQLPMLTLAPEQPAMHLRDYSNIQWPQKEITGPPYQDRTQGSPLSELLSREHQAVEYNKQINQHQNRSSDYFRNHWSQPRNFPSSNLSQQPVDLLTRTPAHNTMEHNSQVIAHKNPGKIYLDRGDTQRPKRVPDISSIHSSTVWIEEAISPKQNFNATESDWSPRLSFQPQLQRKFCTATYRSIKTDTAIGIQNSPYQIAPLPSARPEETSRGHNHQRSRYQPHFSLDTSTVGASPNTRAHISSRVGSLSSPDNQSPPDILSSSSLGQSTAFYMLGDETEYTSDGMGDSSCSMHSPRAPPKGDPSDFLRPILSPIKQDMVLRVMDTF
jgi:hypothetical protein